MKGSPLQNDRVRCADCIHGPDESKVFWHERASKYLFWCEESRRYRPPGRHWRKCRRYRAKHNIIDYPVEPAVERDPFPDPPQLLPLRDRLADAGLLVHLAELHPLQGGLVAVRFHLGVPLETKQAVGRVIAGGEP